MTTYTLTTDTDHVTIAAALTAAGIDATIAGNTKTWHLQVESRHGTDQRSFPEGPDAALNWLEDIVSEAVNLDGLTFAEALLGNPDRVINDIYDQGIYIDVAHTDENQHSWGFGGNSNLTELAGESLQTAQRTAA